MAATRAIGRTSTATDAPTNVFGPGPNTHSKAHGRSDASVLSHEEPVDVALAEPDDTSSRMPISCNQKATIDSV